MVPESIPAAFIHYAADILGETSLGLSGPNIAKATTGYAAEYNVDIPHPSYPFGTPNKRTALYENLLAFSPPQQFRIIADLCNHYSLPADPTSKRQELKTRLATRYAHFSGNNALSEINETLIEETRHWLGAYSDVLALYNAAFEKYKQRIFLRNLLDDLRLALEKLLHEVLLNEKPLENQIGLIGIYISNRGGSKELANMFVKLVDYYSKYQNSYVKHDDSIIEAEIEFIFEITSSFMKHLVRLNSVTNGD